MRDSYEIQIGIFPFPSLPLPFRFSPSCLPTLTQSINIPHNTTYFIQNSLPFFLAFVFLSVARKLSLNFEWKRILLQREIISSFQNLYFIFCVFLF